MVLVSGETVQCYRGSAMRSYRANGSFGDTSSWVVRDVDGTTARFVVDSKDLDVHPTTAVQILSRPDLHNGGTEVVDASVDSERLNPFGSKPATLFLMPPKLGYVVPGVLDSLRRVGTGKLSREDTRASYMVPLPHITRYTDTRWESEYVSAGVELRCYGYGPTRDNHVVYPAISFRRLRVDPQALEAVPNSAYLRATYICVPALRATLVAAGRIDDALVPANYHGPLIVAWVLPQLPGAMDVTTPDVAHSPGPGSLDLIGRFAAMIGLSGPVDGIQCVALRFSASFYVSVELDPGTVYGLLLPRDCSNTVTVHQRAIPVLPT
jgi:hypothetical protein